MLDEVNDLRVLISADRIHARVDQLAAEIDATYAAAPAIHVIGTLHGSFMFVADLVRRLRRPVTLDFLRVSSYGSGTTPAPQVTWRLAPDDVEGRHVLVVEDIVDSGRTLDTIRRRLLAQRPASLRVVTLLDKPACRVCATPVEFVGFTIEDIFVVGYGLDVSGCHRQLPYLAAAPLPLAPRGDRV